MAAGRRKIIDALLFYPCSSGDPWSKNVFATPVILAALSLRQASFASSAPLRFALHSYSRLPPGPTQDAPEKQRFENRGICEIEVGRVGNPSAVANIAVLPTDRRGAELDRIDWMRRNPYTCRHAI